MKRYALLIIGCLLLAGYAQAGEAKVQLLPGPLDSHGRPTEIIARFTINLGWHMYWTNPGDSGLAPQFKWTAPDGVKLGSPKFPIPNRIDAGNGLTSFGYDMELVIFIPIEYSTNELPGGAIKASISYMVCQDVCLKETLMAEIKLAEAKPTEAKLIKDWKSKLPAPAKDLKFGVNYNEDKKSGYLFAAVNAEMKDPEFFPPDADFLVYQKPQRAKLDDQTEVLQIQLRVLEGIKKAKIDNAEAILAYTNNEGQRVGLTFQPDFGFKD